MCACRSRARIVCTTRDPDAAADVPQQVEQAGRRCPSPPGGSGPWRSWSAARTAAPGRRPGRTAARRCPRSRRSGSATTASKRPAALTRKPSRPAACAGRPALDRSRPTSGIDDERAQAARRHREAGLERRVAHQRLQQHRHQHEAAVQPEAHHRDQADAGRVGAVLNTRRSTTGCAVAQRVHDEPRPGRPPRPRAGR